MYIQWKIMKITQVKDASSIEEKPYLECIYFKLLFIINVFKHTFFQKSITKVIENEYHKQYTFFLSVLFKKID